ncbi:hypothetical protein C8R45DRAFT_945170 [Mycena sanguinolenta]|nr:hypothetical protein C8R45DRAFT_945170 [Mycena sanguinolenta]
MRVSSRCVVLVRTVLVSEGSMCCCWRRTATMDAALQSGIDTRRWAAGLTVVDGHVQKECGDVTVWASRAHAVCGDKSREVVVKENMERGGQEQRERVTAVSNSHTLAASDIHTAWWKHKEMHQWLLFGIIQCLSNINPAIWHLMKATTNFGEAQQVANNAETGIEMGLIQSFIQYSLLSCLYLLITPRLRWVLLRDLVENASSVSE